MKNSVPRGFDRMAPVYDALSRLVFGKSIVYSQLYFLNRIPAGANVLILGGGTGWLLEELVKSNPHCHVWYIDASKRMIEKTKTRKINYRYIHVILGTEENIPEGVKYDVVITNFFLDMFDLEKLRSIVHIIQSRMNPESVWIATDFVDHDKWWQKVMLKIMYNFFKIVCNLKSNQLPDWNSLIRLEGLEKIGYKTFYKGFIESALYRN